MSDRLVIEISGALPDTNKYAILAEAQKLAEGLAGELNKTHGLDTTVSVRAVRPGKKGGAANGAANGTAPITVASSELGHG